MYLGKARCYIHTFSSLFKLFSQLRESCISIFHLDEFCVESAIVVSQAKLSPPFSSSEFSGREENVMEFDSTNLIPSPTQIIHISLSQTFPKTHLQMYSLCYGFLTYFSGAYSYNRMLPLGCKHDSFALTWLEFSVFRVPSRMGRCWS